MHNQHSAAGSPTARHAKMIWLTLAKHRRTYVAVMLILTLSAAVSTGYLLGNTNPASAAEIADDSASVAAFTDQIAMENDICAVIEQVNLQQELDAEKERTGDLEQEIEGKQEEIDTIKETILGALMANLNEKSVSRSAKTVTAYRQEAVNLISLNRKLNKFLKSDHADEIDLTTYDAAIDNRLAHLPTMKPISGTYDGYGTRKHPIYGYYHFHPAADVGAAYGTRIKASGAGRVVYSGWGNGSGYYVKIDHGNGFMTTYMHCSKLLVSTGQTVTKGTVIGNVGSTGSSTTPHLHYEVHFNGTSISPKTMLLE